MPSRYYIQLNTPTNPHPSYHTLQRGAGSSCGGSADSPGSPTAYNSLGRDHAHTAACTLEDLRKAILQRDPLDIGYG